MHVTGYSSTTTTYYSISGRFAFSEHAGASSGEKSQGRDWASADLSISHFQLQSHFLRSTSVRRKVASNHWLFQPWPDLSVQGALSQAVLCHISKTEV